MTAVDHVQAIRDSLPPSHEWTERDATILDLAAQQAADLDRLQGLIAQDGSRIAAIREARQCRIALGRLLGLVDIPTEPTTATLHARKAAQKRWAEVS
jgi:hypothetical protein